jgi:hypothetical protein
VPAPKLLASAADISRLVVHAPSVIWDLTTHGSARSGEYGAIWPDAVTYAYSQDAAVDPHFVPIPHPLSDAPNWGARVSPSHGVLASIGVRPQLAEGSLDTAFTSTIDIVAEQCTLRQIALLVLPASATALAPLLGASGLLAAANILAVAILDQPQSEAPSGILGEVAGILAKFGYRWATIDGTAYSLAVPERAKGILLAREPNGATPSWLQAAQSLHIPLRGMIHVGDGEAREVQRYVKQGLQPLFIIGANAQTHRRLTTGVSGDIDVIYVDAPIGEALGAAMAGSEAATLDSLAIRHDFRACNLLHLELPTVGLSGIAGAEHTLRQIDIVDVELKRAAESVDSISISEVDACLRQYGFLRTGINTSLYPLRDDVAYVRAELLWARDPLRAACLALQQADVSVKKIGVIAGDPHGIALDSGPCAEHEQLVEISLPGIGQNRTETEIAPLGSRHPPEDFGYKVAVAYVLQHLKSAEQQSAAGSVAPAPDIDVLVLTDGSIETFRAAVEATRNSTRLSAIVVLGTLSDRALASAISNAFDLGFLLERSTAAITGRVFIRSELISEPGRWLRLNNRFGNSHFYFSSLGNIGRFGNQLFQFWHLILSGLRHNASVSSRKGGYEEYFGIEFLAKQGGGNILHVESYDWRVMGLWALESLPPDIDFYGHFQWIPPLLHRHRVFLNRLFDLPPKWAEEMSKVIHTLRSFRKPLAVFHVRRTDYINHVNPIMRLIPGAWYKSTLEQLRDCTIYVASDELESVQAEFREFTLLSCNDFADSQLPPLLIDHCVMRAADTLLAINSTFSRSAAMLGKDAQATLLPSIHDKAFQPYAPWSDPIFWFRFRYDDPEEFTKASMEVDRWLTSAGLTG